MKALFASIALIAATALPAVADIHDPALADYGPSRKLGRGLNNILFCTAEMFVTPATINDRDGNAAAWSYGAVKGIGRTFARLGYGVYEVFTFPAPTYRKSYKAPYRSNLPWVHSGYEEFAPELGFTSRYRYVRSTIGYH